MIKNLKFDLIPYSLFNCKYIVLLTIFNRILFKVLKYVVQVLKYVNETLLN